MRINKITAGNMWLGYTAGGRNQCFRQQCMAGQQSRLDEQLSAFGYVVGHFNFMGRRIGRAVRAINAAASPSLFRCNALIDKGILRQEQKGGRSTNYGIADF
jgi:hypothetical protein